MDLRGLTLTREQIARYAKEERTIRAIEGAQADVVEIGNALTTAPFLTLSNNPSLGAERALVLTGDLTAIDAGANSTYTLGLADTAVVPGVYGSASKTLSLIVTSTGRITGVTEFALSTTNIAEGTKLFYTDARARLAVSATAPLSYNNGTGVFSITGSALTKTDDTNVTLTLGGTPASALLAAASLTLGWTGTLSVARGGTGVGTMAANALPKGNGTGAYTASNLSDDGNTVSVASGKGFSIARTAVTTPAAADGNVYSGTYTPTLFNVANVAASAAFACQYMRVGVVVTVSGRVEIDPTTISTLTQLGMSLPIASNFTLVEQCGGTGVTAGVAGQSIAVQGDTTNDRAQFAYICTDTANRSVNFSFTYLIA